MSTSLTPIVLSHITKEIDTGRPLIALLRARSYLDPSSEIWIHLKFRALKKLGAERYQVATEIIGAILNGSTLQDLKPDQRLMLLQIREPENCIPYNWKIPKPRWQSGLTPLRIVKRRSPLRIRKFKFTPQFNQPIIGLSKRHKPLSLIR